MKTVKTAKPRHKPPKPVAGSRAQKAKDARHRRIGLLCDLALTIDVQLPPELRNGQHAIVAPEKHRLIGEMVRLAMFANMDVVKHCIEHMKTESERRDRERRAELAANERNRPKVFLQLSLRRDEPTKHHDAKKKT